MDVIVIVDCFRKESVHFDSEQVNGADLKSTFPNHVISVNGRLLKNEDEIRNDEIYRANVRVLGGKGGFGSLLRAFGKQILISNNKDACRDLNGRRMKDVNNEKKLKEWLLNQAERKQQKENKLTRLQRKRDNPSKHFFNDENYMKQKEDLLNDVHDAVDEGFKEFMKSGGKRMKLSSESQRKFTDRNFLLGLDEDQLSDSGEEIDDSESNESNDNDSDEEEEIICISQELYNKLINEDFNLAAVTACDDVNSNQLLQSSSRNSGETYFIDKSDESKFDVPERNCDDICNIASARMTDNNGRLEENELRDNRCDKADAGNDANEQKLEKNPAVYKEFCDATNNKKSCLEIIEKGESLSLNTSSESDTDKQKMHKVPFYNEPVNEKNRPEVDLSSGT